MKKGYKGEKSQGSWTSRYIKEACKCKKKYLEMIRRYKVNEDNIIMSRDLHIVCGLANKNIKVKQYQKYDYDRITNTGIFKDLVYDNYIFIEVEPNIYYFWYYLPMDENHHDSFYYVYCTGLYESIVLYNSELWKALEKII